MLTHSRVWYLMDAANQRPGRIAAQISAVLQGKYKPIFHRSQDSGDHVVVINAGQIDFSGSKWDKKMYKWHTHWPGGFREIKAKTLHEKKPTEVVRKAIYGMLPRNKLRARWMDRLYLFEDGDHPYANNVFANLQGSATAEDVVTIPPWVLQAPGDTHLIDAMVGDGPVEEETLLHIPAASK